MSKQRTETALATVDEVRRCLVAGRPGRYLLRPRVMLSRVESVFGVPRFFSLPFPSSDIGSITTLEATMLVAMQQLLKPQKIFEFGTFRGYSTRLLALNAPEHCEVVTIDLPMSESPGTNGSSNDAILTDGHANDSYLTAVQATDGPVYLGVEPVSNVRQLRGNSREFDPHAEGLAGNVDFVFVDGAHDYETAKIDSRNALEMIGESGIVIWHDVGSSLHNEVDSVIKELSDEHAVLGIANTMLAFIAKGDAIGRIIGND